MKKIITLLALICLMHNLNVKTSTGGIAYAADSNISNEKNATQPQKRYPAATGSTTPGSKNIADWDQYFKDRGMGSGSIGTGMGVFSNTQIGQAAFGGDPASLSNENIGANQSLKDIKSVNSYTDSLRSSLMTAAMTNSVFQPNGDAKTVKCYITRNIPLGWKCLYTGLTYSGNKYGSVDKTKQACEQQCYQQYSCVNLEQDVTQKTDTLDDKIFSLSTKTSESFTILADTKRIASYLSFQESKNGSARYTITYTNKNGKTSVVTQDMLTDANNKTERTFYINDVAYSITVTIKKEAIGGASEIQIQNISLVYKENNRYVCPSVQDLSGINPGQFSYKCPSGNIYTVGYGSQSYTICKDGWSNGDNIDGTYSGRGACESVCRYQHKCEQAFDTINTEALKTFEEGCIEGTPNCNNASEDCKKARLSGAKVANETIFDSGNIPQTTIVNSVQVAGASRPRVLLNEDISFEKRTMEEWKDSAYKQMWDAKTYDTTKSSLTEDTNASSAYLLKLEEGNAYGAANTSRQSLYWKLKPKAFDVASGKTFFIYIVLSAITEYGYSYNANGEKTEKHDNIWYLKTATGFKPFRRAVDAYRKSGIDNPLSGIFELTFAKNEYASYKNETFSGSAWYPVGAAETADYYATETFENPKLYFEYLAVDNIAKVQDSLPGLIKSSVENGPYVAYSYTGNFNGSGDAVAKWKIYGIYSQSKMSYGEMQDLIDNSQVSAFYEVGSELNYAKDIIDDSEKNNAVQIYRYGKPNKASAFTRIIPSKQDVGKKGFIFVFVY